MRNTFAETFYEAGKNGPAPLRRRGRHLAGRLDCKFRERVPRRFINTGVAEQIMIGICAGMALRGLRPFAYTIATFTLYRPFEMVRDDLCYQNLPVTIVGIGGGVTYSTLGGTHHAQEDVAHRRRHSQHVGHRAVRSAETESRHAVVHRAEARAGLSAHRQGRRAGLHLKAPDPWEFGKLRYLKKGHDVCILSYGPIMKMAAGLTERFEKAGKCVSLVSVHTLKPLDRDGHRRRARRSQARGGHRGMCTARRLSWVWRRKLPGTGARPAAGYLHASGRVHP